MALTANVKTSISGSLVSALDLGTVTFPFSVNNDKSLTAGTGNGAVDKLFADQRTLGASGTEDLDLAGTLVDATGTVITMAKVKVIMIKAAAGNTNDVVLSRPAANGVPLFAASSDAIAIKPGGTFLWMSPNTGVAVTPATGDLLTITNSAGTTGVTYDIVIMGTSV